MRGGVKEGDESGKRWRGVKPIRNPGVGREIGPAAQPDVHAIDAMKEHGEKNNGPFHGETERNGLQIAGSLVVFGGADERRAIGPKMLGEKCANRKHARKRMKLSE